LHATPGLNRDDLTRSVATRQQARNPLLVAERTSMATGFAHDPTELAAELVHLRHEERQLSDLRRRLHEQIDNGFPNEVTIRREREVSDRRRMLHRRIDALAVRVSGSLRPAF
jgi:hypothetical protein